MHKRLQEDQDKVVNSAINENELISWLDELFLGSRSSGFRFPDEIYEWWREEAITNYRMAKNDYVRMLMKQKMLHTWEVVEAGFDIARNSPEVDWDWYLVGSVCLLHDIARFKQAHFESYSDEKTGFDHAGVGAEMIRRKDINDPWWVGVRETVAQAVEWHSRITCEIREPYALFVRDADKLGLLRYMPYLIDMRVYEAEGVTSRALEDYLAKRMVKHSDMKTRADVCLAWGAWEIDLNYGGTKEAFVNEGIKMWIMSELSRLGVEINTL